MESRRTGSRRSAVCGVCAAWTDDEVVQDDDAGGGQQTPPGSWTSIDLGLD